MILSGKTVVSVLFIVTLFAIVFVVHVHAQNEQPGSAVDVSAFFRSILVALIAGFLISALGYFKSTDPKGFVPGKLLATLLASVCVSLVMVSLGWNYSNVEQWLASCALTILVYWIAKIVSKGVASRRKHTLPIV
jgi:hypothetical protein